MSGTRSVLHRRLSHFVTWLAPEPAKEEEIRRQADDIRTRIKAQAARDGLIVRSTPAAGSFTKRTGLRRHMTGGSEVEGLDVDLPFVVAPRTRDDEELRFLLDRFERYAAATYPSTECKRGKSAVRLSFKSARRDYDLVPLLATESPDLQILIRANGERIVTAVQRHVEFIQRRTRRSNELRGRVKFNECVRLVKWCREFRQSSANTPNGSPELPRVPSFLLELLCAHAYETCEVEETYAVTLLRWFRHMSGVARQRTRVAFRDFPPLSVSTGQPVPSIWEALDPVNPDNNIVATWNRQNIDALAAWLENAATTLEHAIQCDREGRDAQSLGYLVKLFGTPIKHHCDDA